MCTACKKQIHNALDSRNEALITAMNHVAMFLSDLGFQVPVPVRATGGDLIAMETLPINGGVKGSDNGGVNGAGEEGE